MESGPPEIIEAIAWLLLPPACREEVLGDLSERYSSLSQYLLEAVEAILCVIYSRICRTTDGVVALMELGTMYTALILAAWWLNPAFLLSGHCFASLAIPPAIVVLAIIVGDAYSVPGRRWPFKPILAPAIGFALASIAQAILGGWALPETVFAWGGMTGLLCVSVLRVAFPPLYERPLGISGPSHWRKLELVSLWGDAKPALLILVMIILYLLGKK